MPWRAEQFSAYQCRAQMPGDFYLVGSCFEEVRR